MKINSTDLITQKPHNTSPSKNNETIKTRWESKTWGQLRRFSLHVDCTGNVIIKEISKGSLSFLGRHFSCLSPIAPFAPKRSVLVQNEKNIPREILSSLNEEQRVFITNWQRSAITNQFPNVHKHLEELILRIDALIALVFAFPSLKECLIVLKEEIEEQKQLHINDLKKAKSSAEFKEIGYRFVQRAKLFDELYVLYKNETLKYNPYAYYNS